MSLFWLEYLAELLLRAVSSSWVIFSLDLLAHSCIVFPTIRPCPCGAVFVQQHSRHGNYVLVLFWWLFCRLTWSSHFHQTEELLRDPRLVCCWAALIEDFISNFSGELFECIPNRSYNKLTIQMNRKNSLENITFNQLYYNNYNFLKSNWPIPNSIFP